MTRDAFETLYATLLAADLAAQLQAHKKLVKISDDEKRQLVPAIIQHLDRGDWQAAQLLEEFGPAARDAGPALLVKLIHSPDSLLKFRAASALGEVGFNTAATVAALHGALSHEYKLLRIAAARSLLIFGLHVEESLAILAALAHDEDRATRTWANAVPSELCAAVPAARGLALATLAHDDDEFVESACRGLARCPPDEIFPALLIALKSTNQRMRWGALMAIEEFSGKAARWKDAVTRQLLACKVLSSPSPDVRRLAANVSQSLQLDASALIDGLLGLVDDGDRWVREQACRAVIEMVGTTDRQKLIAARRLRDDGNLDFYDKKVAAAARELLRKNGESEKRP